MSDREYTNFEELEKLSDQELQDLVVEGSNLHIHTSKASVAKRILDKRIQNRQIKVVKDMETVTNGLKEVIKFLDFFKTRWFPQQSVLIKVGVFLFGTLVLGVIMNLISDAISKFILHW